MSCQASPTAGTGHLAQDSAQAAVSSGPRQERPWDDRWGMAVLHTVHPLDFSKTNFKNDNQSCCPSQAFAAVV